MASIFKRGRDRNDRTAPYFIAYTDHEGRRRMRKGFRDKGLTEQLAAKIENEVMLRKSGLIDPQQERVAEQKRRPIEDHLQEFEGHLEGKGNTGKHVKLTLQRVRAVVNGCHVASLNDLTRAKVEQFLCSIRGPDGCGHRTSNHYAQAVESFCNWLCAEHRLPANPLRGLSRVNAEVDRRHHRRALEPEEVARLVQAARASTRTVQTYPGEQRARIYIFTYMTGLRRSEMASLTPRSFDLSGTPPTVTVDAACSKHRKTDVIPLHPDLVNMLREWLAGMEPDEHLFPKLDRRKTWLMVQHDLEKAGIPYEDENGLFADFHGAGRHSFITALLSSGATLTEARELARHGDIRMTMRYTHISINDQASALAGLPAPVTPAPVTVTVVQAATGTNGPNIGADTWQRPGSAPAVSACLSVSSDGEALASRAGGLQTPKPCQEQGFGDVSLLMAIPGEGDQKRGRRDSNPQPPDRQARASAFSGRPIPLVWKGFTVNLGRFRRRRHYTHYTSFSRVFE